MPLDLNPLYAFYGFTALAAVLAAEACYLLLSGAKTYRSGINRRLALSQQQNDREQILLQLKRERGMGSGDEGRLSGLRRLVVQSGLRLTPILGAATLTACAGLGFTAAFFMLGDIAASLVAGVAAALALPPAMLLYLRKKRRDRFGEQLAEAIDVVVRSLRAGHPVPVAIGMVAREMPDPVGTEFGMVFDEITYGKDLEAALRALSGRIGQEDLPLFVTSVAIQVSTGGNLSQILENLSKVIRERYKMRRKIRGLSAEARTSALILNLTPIIVFTLVNVTSPKFYAEVWGHELALWFFGGALGWMAIGNLIMRRMINFKI